MAVILRIDHRADTLNTYFSAGRDRFIFGGLQGHTVLTCTDAKATRAAVRACLGGHDVTLVLGAGHGDPDGFDGSDGQPIWHCDHDLDDAPTRTFSLLCCSAAQRLGARLVERGARAFYGYAERFVVPISPPPCDPGSDPVAAPFLEMAAQVDLSLLAGDPSEAVLERVARYVERTLNTIADREHRALFFENYQALQCIEPDGVTLRP